MVQIQAFVFLLVPYFVIGTCPNIVSRSEWGAKSPKKVTRLTENPPKYVVVHHADTPNCETDEKCKSRVQSIQSYHMGHNGWDDIGYNFLIGGNGKVYEGRGWGISGAHAPNYNSHSIGICMIGKFGDIEPSEIQLNALKSLIKCAEDKQEITENYRLVGHRQVRQTSCPGDKLFEIVKQMPHFFAHPPVHP